MAINIYPTENDVGTNQGDGIVASEANMTAAANAPVERIGVYREGLHGGTGAFVETGLDYDSGSSSGLTAVLFPGTAVIKGSRVVIPAADPELTQTLTASKHNHLYLVLSRDASDNVTSASISINATDDVNDLGTSPVATSTDDALLLVTLVTDATTITASYDYRYGASSLCTGMYLGDGTSDRKITLGFRPRIIQVRRMSQPNVVAWSDIGFPDTAAPFFGCTLVSAGETHKVFGATNLVNRSARPEIAIDGFFISGVTQPGPGAMRTETTAWDPPDLGGNLAVTISDYIAGKHSVIPAAYFTQGILADTLTVTTLTNPGDEGKVNVELTTTVDPPAGVLHLTVFEPGNDFSLNDNAVDYQFLAWA